MRIRRMKTDQERAAGQVCVLKERGSLQGKKEKIYKPGAKKPQGFIENILHNPNLSFQIMVIIMTLVSDSGQMERRIDGVTSAVEKVRNIADLLSNTMSSVKTASETPRKIRQMLE